MADTQNRPEKPDLPQWFVEQLKAVKAKRPKVVIDHILEYGYVTTEELRDLYSYDHPPRAARDVREQGIPLETFRVTGKQGRRIGAYKFGDPADVQRGRLGGRKAWPKSFKDDLTEAQGSKCAICLTGFQSRELQIDHRIPYEVGGEPRGVLQLTDFMLLCGSCNRAKSWPCEHCRNWKVEKAHDVCGTCYWASPATYAHVALRLIRRLDISWSDAEIPEYDRLIALSEQEEKELPDFVKSVLRRQLDDASK